MTGRDQPPSSRSGTGGMAELYWEDLTPGRRFDLGVTEVDRAEMLAFARRYDPQWYHVDEALAAASEYGDLIASGFFTVSLFMRAYVDGLLARAAAAASPGLEELRWLAPVYAGDRLAVGLEVLASGPSRARPGCGTVTLRGTMTRLAAGDDPPAQPSTARTGQPTEPRTGQPAEPRNGQPAEPRNGQPAEPRNGQPAEPRTGQPAEPRTGQPAEPRTGQPADPVLRTQFRGWFRRRDGADLAGSETTR